MKNKNTRATKKSYTVTSANNKSTDLIGRTVFTMAHKTKITSSRCFLKTLFYNWCFAHWCARSNWRPLFSHEALNLSENCPSAHVPSVIKLSHSRLLTNTSALLSCYYILRLQYKE